MGTFSFSKPKRLFLDRPGVKLFAESFRLYPKLFFSGLIWLVVVDVSEAFVPLFMKWGIDDVMLAKGSEGIEKAPFSLNQSVFAIAALTVVAAVGRFGWRKYLLFGSHFAGRDLKSRFSKSLYSLSFLFFQKKKIGELMSLSNSDTEAVRNALASGLIVAADAVFYLATVPLLMIYLSPYLTLLCLIPLLLIPFFMYAIENKIHESYEAVQDQYALVSGFGQESLTSAKMVKGFSVEEKLQNQFDFLGKEYRVLSNKLAFIQGSVGPVLDFIASLGMVALIVASAPLFFLGTISVGTFVAFTRYVQRLIWPMIALGIAYTFFQRAFTSGDRLDAIWKEANPNTHEIKELKSTPESHVALIEAKNLQYFYPETPCAVFKPLNFTLREGQHAVIVGESGSGKTTLIYLLTGFLTPKRGQLFFRGIDYCDLNPEQLRSQLAVCLQDGFLFRDTIEQNVALGKQLNIENENHIRNLLQIFDLPEQFKLEERGLNLSGGQKQRLAFARALFRLSENTTDILVLDDPLSAVDGETEDKILKRIEPYVKRKTQIWVTHRQSIAKKAHITIEVEGETHGS